MGRTFSGIQPSGNPHLGNLLGAMVNYVKHQDEHDSVFCVVDLHAVTVPQDPAQLRQQTIDLTNVLMAVGLDPDKCILFAQSHVPEHNQLGWLMECTTGYGELSRMTQFKDKSDRTEFISAGLFTYPALQAADILLYDTDFVPVGDDQRQHIELTRDVAERFNSRYGETFVIPQHVIPASAARIMDLQRPENKMSKSTDESSGTILLLDDPKQIEKRFKRAVTDSDNEVRYDRETKPGVSNLLDILSAVTGTPPQELATNYTQYGPLKADTAAAVLDVIGPIQERYAELSADPGNTVAVLEQGAAKAREIASVVYDRAATNVGFLRPS